MEFLWSKYFADVPRKNRVDICFGRYARNRLGSIKLVRSIRQGVRSRERGVEENNRSPYSGRAHSSLITITGYFKDEKVPEFMVFAVIAHELCHYAHGFSSPLPQLFRYPHQGKAVDREMIKRGLGDILLQEQRWLRHEWKKIIGPPPKNRVRRKKYL